MQANGKRTTRVVIDVVLTIMIVFEMFIQYTGQTLHEIVGFAFFATILTHIALSAKWIKNTAGNAKKGKMTGRRTALAVIGILLAITTTVLAVSSIAISGLLADAGFVWALGSYSMWVTIHAISSYTLCALVVVHLGMHWAFLASAFRVPYDPSRRKAIGTGVHAVAAVGALALGIMAVNEAIPRTAVAGTTSQSGDAGLTGSASDTPANPNGSSGENSTGNATENSTKGKSGKQSKKRSYGEDSTRSEAPGTAAPGNSAENSGNTSNENSSGQGSTNEAPSGNGSSSNSSATGICTLCRKQCPLSAPKCNKPYDAGLI